MEIYNREWDFLIGNEVIDWVFIVVGLKVFSREWIRLVGYVLELGCRLFIRLVWYGFWFL